MPKLTYTEKWYQAAHCILDAIEAQKTQVKDLSYFIERMRFGNKPQMPQALIDIQQHLTAYAWLRSALAKR